MRAAMLACLAAAGPSNAAGESSEPDVAAGETLYQSVCKNCHGPTAKGMASFPKLAGRDAAYLSERLMQYRSGEKVGPNTALMAPHAAKLSDQDIANLAAYITSLDN